MRKDLAIAILVGSIILLAYYLSRPKPLHPIVVTWKEIGEVEDFVDLDGDGDGELLVRDKSDQFWWVQFRLPTPIRQKIPVPKGVDLFSEPRGQMLIFVHPKTHHTFLITRQGKRWVLKDLGKLDGFEVTDADHDGQINDVIVRRGRTRTVFSRKRDGTIVERPDLPDWRADLDGDGKDDAVYKVGGVVGEVQIHFSSGHKEPLKFYPAEIIAVTDMDGDKVAEIVGAEWEVGARFHCWHYANGRWQRSSSPKFGGIYWHVFGNSLFRDEKSAYLLAVTKEGKRVKVWKVRWQKGKWIKRLMGEVPERIARVTEIELVRTGQAWLVVGWASPPEWQEWLWEKMAPLQRFLPFLHEPRGRFFVYGWNGQRKWILLGRWHEESYADWQFVDMDGDGQQELTIAFPKKVLVSKFEDGRWRTGWVEVPLKYEHELFKSLDGFRYGGREWSFYQDQSNHRCVAIALEKRR